MLITTIKRNVSSASGIQIQVTSRQFLSAEEYFLTTRQKRRSTLASRFNIHNHVCCILTTTCKVHTAK